MGRVARDRAKIVHADAAADPGALQKDPAGPGARALREPKKSGRSPILKHGGPDIRCPPDRWQKYKDQENPIGNDAQQ
eukprot:2917399-Pyramimonas_sp.AAC.1